MRVIRPGKTHRISVKTCEHCEAMFTVKTRECVKLVLQDDSVVYVCMCPECSSQVMIGDDKFAYPVKAPQSSLLLDEDET